MSAGEVPLVELDALAGPARDRELVARCRGGDRAAAFRTTPYVDWTNYWATGDSASLLPGTKGVGGRI